MAYLKGKVLACERQQIDEGIKKWLSALASRAREYGELECLLASGKTAG